MLHSCHRFWKEELCIIPAHRGTLLGPAGLGARQPLIQNSEEIVVPSMVKFIRVRWVMVCERACPTSQSDLVCSVQLHNTLVLDEWRTGSASLTSHVSLPSLSIHAHSFLSSVFLNVSPSVSLALSLCLSTCFSSFVTHLSLNNFSLFPLFVVCFFLSVFKSVSVSVSVFRSLCPQRRPVPQTEA